MGVNAERKTTVCREAHILAIFRKFKRKRLGKVNEPAENPRSWEKARTEAFAKGGAEIDHEMCPLPCWKKKKKEEIRFMDGGWEKMRIITGEE